MNLSELTWPEIAALPPHMPVAVLIAAFVILLVSRPREHQHSTG